MAVESAGLDMLGNTPRNRGARNGWASNYIATLENAGISVFDDSSLDVNAPAPRGAVVQILLETFGVNMQGATGAAYNDVAKSSKFADAVETATQSGIVSGDDNASTFRPRQPVNRAETAKIIDKMIEVYGE
ncbi:MAG: S-layer homology domain-containing protein [bacterium]|nr:S-layer homology domain-containing protein [bacterium]